MDSFATPAMMEQRSRGAIATASHPFLAQEIDAASRLIRDRCGWHVASIAQITHKRRGRFVEDVWLPAMKITEIRSVKIDGVEWADLSTVDFDEDTGWTNLRGRSVEVTFEAGFDEVPESIVGLTLQIAARALGAPLGVIREQTLSASVTHTTTGSGAAGGDVILDHEHSTLVPYILGTLP